MIAAVVVGVERRPGNRRAAELAAPDHQRVVEQAALLEIVDQGRRRLVGVVALARGIASAGCRAGPSRGDRAARTARPARPAAGRAGSWRRTCRAASRPGRTARSVCCGSCERSVSSGTLVCMRKAISYCAMRVAISGSPTFCELQAVELRERHRASAPARRRSMPGGFDKIQHRIAAAAELARPDAATAGSRCPTAVVQRLIARLPPEIITTKRRQVLVLAAQAVGEPRTEARPAG